MKKIALIMAGLLAFFLTLNVKSKFCKSVGRDLEKDVRSFSEGLASVLWNKGWGYIDMKEDFVVKPQFRSAEEFSEGLACVEYEYPDHRPTKYGYIDKTGKAVVKPRFEAAGKFSGGIARVRLNNLWGYINRTGKIVIESQFSQAGDFSGEIAAVNINGKWG